MKVLDLQCAHQHVFEGWFGSDDEFRGQLARGLVSCPMCGSRELTRRLSAPRLQRKSNSRSAAAAGPTAAEPTAPTRPATPSAAASPDAAAAQTRQLAYLAAVRQVLQNTDDVGERFAEEARRMHYGEAEERGIRGRTSAEEREALAEEGIEVLSLPLPDGLDGSLQ